MFDENAFSLDSFDQDSWLFLLEVPYFDLSGKQRIYVRSVLESVYATSEVERIVSVAVQNNISVLDAATAVRVSTEPLQIIVRNERKTSAEKPAREPARSPMNQGTKNLPAYVLTEENRAFARAEATAVFAATQAQTLVASTGGITIFTKE